MRRPPVLFFSLVVATTACASDVTTPDGDDPGGDDWGADPGGPGGGDSGDPDDPFVPQDPVFAEEHPRIYLQRNRERLVAALESGRPAATAFRQMVDTQMGGANLWDFRSWFAALLGQLTGDDRYCTYAVNRVDAFVAEQEATIAGGGRPSIAADSYLESGPRLGDVMLTYDWCFDHLSSGQRSRWLALAAQTVHNIWNPSEATWGGRSHPWSGWSVDNPSNNYYYSFLRATMLFGLAAHGEHPDAQGWLDFFQAQKVDAQLLPTLEQQLEGGGSREGTGYGTAMARLWEIYDFWHGSTGEDLARQTRHTRASLLHMLHAIVPTRDRLAPTGDHSRDATAALYDSHRNYLLELIYLFRDDPLARGAKWLLANSSVPRMTQGYMKPYDFLYDEPSVTEAPMTDLGRVYYGPGTGQVYARSSWETDATWINLIAGPYTESHAHKDQGALMIFKGGWLAHDANVASNDGIHQHEELHNLVRIVQNGQTVRQREGTISGVTALARGDGWVHVAADLTAAYDGHAAVDNVEREVVFLEPDVVIVYDRVATAAGTQQVWQLNSPAQAVVSGNRATIDGGAHELHVTRVLPASPTVTSRSWPSIDSTVRAGYRLDETSPGGAVEHLHVLSIDGAVTSVTRSDAGGRTGVTVALAGGRTATVRFSPTGVDGTLELRSGNTVTASAQLVGGVDAVPE